MNIIERLKTEKIAVHCDTEEKHKEFLKVLHDKELSWNSGRSLIDYDFFNYLCPINVTCYIVNQNSRVEYSEKEFYENENYKIISYDEFMKLYIDEIIDKEATVEKQETNIERLLNFLIDVEFRPDIDNCSIYKLVFKTPRGYMPLMTCDKFKEFAKELYQEDKPKIKLNKFEHDLLCTVSGERNGFKFGNHQFKAMRNLVTMKEKGHFKDIDVEMTLEEILNSCEVVND